MDSINSNKKRNWAKYRDKYKTIRIPKQTYNILKYYCKDRPKIFKGYEYKMSEVISEALILFLDHRNKGFYYTGCKFEIYEYSKTFRFLKIITLLIKIVLKLCKNK